MGRLKIPLLLLLVLVAFSRAGAQAGFGRFVLPEDDPSAFKIITPADLDEAVRKLARLRNDLASIKNEKERKAQLTAILNICQQELDKEVNATGTVAMLDGPVGDDGRQDIRRWLGAYNAIEAQIRALGKEGLALYEELNGKRAENLLLAAAAGHDLPGILDINKRFGLTQAGIKAALLLAQIEWEEGNLSPAARALERALEFRELHQPQTEANISAWLGRCYRELGERANLAQLRIWIKPYKDLEVDVGGGQRKLDELLVEEYGRTRDSTNDTVEDQGVCWPGGNFANTGIPAAPSPPDRVAWAQTLPRLESDWWQLRYMGYQYPTVPPYLPVSDGTMLYVNTGDAVAAYDVLTGGKRAGEPMWRCKPYARNENYWRTAEPDPALTLPVSVYRGTVYAPLENPMRSPIHQRSADNRFGLYSHYPQVRRSLCAVDAETGRLLWKIGGQYEGNDLEQTSFGPAVVHEGTLYAIGTRVPGLADVVLCALDPQNGNLRWSMRLCYGQQEVTMFGRPARWPFTSLPAIAGGQLYLCTNLGGIVAVNLERRCLAWIAKYEYMVRPMTSNIYTYYRPSTWFNSPTICAEVSGERYVISAPADSQNLICLNARTGEQVWQLARAVRNGDDYIDSRAPLADARALIGVRNSMVLVGGESRLYGIDLATGRILKSVQVMANIAAGRSEPNELQGRPALAGNKLYWPGNRGITAFELETWRSGVTVSAPSLNAVQGLSVYCQQGILFTIAGVDYTAGNPQVAARFDPQLLLTDARLRVANAPEDGDAALRYGLLNLRMGDKAEARKWLEKAFSLAGGIKVDTRVLNLSGRVLVTLSLEQADAMIDAGRFVEALGQVEASRKYATLPSQFTELFVRQELCLIKRGEVAALRFLYSQLIEQDPGFGVGQDPEIPARLYASIMLARMDAQLKGNEASALGMYESLLAAPDSLQFERISLRQLGINGISALLESAGREIYVRRETEAVTLLNAGDRDSLRTILRLYPHALASDDAALKLAEGLFADGNNREAAAMLQSALDERSARPKRGELLTMLALAQNRMGEALRARLTARRVLREFPDGELSLEGKRRKFKDVLAELVAAKSTVVEGPLAPKIGSPLIELWSEEWEPTSKLGFLFLPQQPAAGQPPVILTLRSTGESPLRAVNPSDGEAAWSGGSLGMGALNNGTRLGEAMLLEFTRGISLYNDRGQDLWTYQTGGTPQNVDAREGMVLLSVPGDGTRRTTCRVIALDATTGAQTWNSQVEASDVLWVRQCSVGALVLVSNGREDRLLLLDLENGAELKRVKLERMASRNVRCKPILTDSGVNIVDDRGDITCYAAEDFSLQARVVSSQARPKLFAQTQKGLLVVGWPGIALCDMGAQKAIWKTPYKNDEVLMDCALTGDVLILALSERYESDRLMAISLTDGSQVFEHKLEPTAEGEKVKLKARVELQDAAAFSYAVFDASTGISELLGFKLLVIGNDGRVRLDWFVAANSISEFMQLAAIDGYIVLTADRTTHCFGVK
jgi:outer membrane protein assembly factor BamB/tetratricopeptide (TPR) repeat protein